MLNFKNVYFLLLSLKKQRHYIARPEKGKKLFI